MGIIRRIVNQVLVRVCPSAKLLIRGSNRSFSRQPTFSLTFDDGPHPVHTPLLLDTLKEYGIVATFFVVGKNAELYPDIMQRIRDDGHEIGNHTYSHLDSRTVSSRDFMADIHMAENLLIRWTTIPCRLMRPPYGKLKWFALRELWKNRYFVIMWSMDSEDHAMNSASDARGFAKRVKPSHGDIVLLHDIHSYANEILCTWKEDGVFERMRTARVSEWLQAGVS